MYLGEHIAPLLQVFKEEAVDNSTRFEEFVINLFLISIFSNRNKI